MTAHKRGKTMLTADYVEILNADGTPEEIALAVGRPVSTVKRVLKLMPLADTFRMGFVQEKLAEAGIDGLVLPDDGEIGALIGLQNWRKSKHIVQETRGLMENIAEMKRDLAGMEMINGAMERVAHGGLLN